MSERLRIQVQGIVQGVGFRPFVYGLAQQHRLGGLVRNDTQGVTIEVEGEAADIQGFLAGVRDSPPPLAHIEQMALEPVRPCGEVSFAIEASEAAALPAGTQALVSPDIGVCDDCLRELFDPADRRFHYPFINCTNCGPRYSIIRAVPYDRAQTTMAPFEMCPACRREYADPLNRRFHAQPNACPVCGPQLRLLFSNCQWSSEADLFPITDMASALLAAQRLLAGGAILAIKGLGGYHLACDAANPEAVRRLRQRKHRPDKPLALMAASLEAVEAVCELSPAEREALLDRRRPIVLLKRRRDAPQLAPEVGPRLSTLGVMLPYTPLHYLLFAAAPFSLLVMTSGNVSDEPLAFEDGDAFRRLAPLADAFLTHNRAIHARVDDSIVQSVELAPDPLPLPLRRGRGFAPQPIALAFDCRQPILAAGGHLKNTFCLASGRRAFLSPHIGDLDNIETLAAYRAAAAHLRRLFDIEPAVVAHDLHPDYLSTQYALVLPGVQRVAVQHHHAHIASVMAEHNLAGPVIGVAFDGTGLGPDRTIWGGEFLLADLARFERAAYLRQVPMAGGEQAIHQPWRLAVAWLERLYGEAWRAWDLPFARAAGEARLRGVQQMLARGLNCPLTSSMGRLFDAVAALIDVRGQVTYEGQAAIELEALSAPAETGAYAFDQAGPVIDPAPVFAALLADLHAGASVAVMGARFHNAVANLTVSVCQRLRAQHGLNTVALSGGVFQNACLLSRTLAGLAAAGFAVYTNQQVPPNDGGLALGQVAVAAAQLA